MGLENRDYIRDAPPPHGYGYGPRGYWGVKYLLIANIAVFVLQVVTDQRVLQNPGVRVGGVTEWLSLNLSNLINPDPSQGFQFWRLVTYGFCHGGFTHILFNLFVLWMFGRIVEPIIGSLEFLLFFLAGVVISGLCHVAAQAVFVLPQGVVGASGGVMAVVFLTAMIYPREKVYLFGIIPMEMRVMAVLYAVIDVIGALNPMSGVAHWAHLGGAAFGVGYHHFQWRLSGFWTGLRKRVSGPRIRRARPRVRVYQPEEPEPRNSDIDEQVDRLLEKISKHGEASLTEKERTFLAEASRRYRNR